MEKKYFTTKELSEYISVSKQTIYEWVAQGKIPVTKIGRLRFKKETIDRWLKEHTIEPDSNF